MALYRQPAYPLVQSWLARLLGRVLGLHVLPLLGAVGAAAPPGRWPATRWRPPAHGVLARRPEPRRCSTGCVVWAHAPVAALAGLAALAAVRLLRPGRPRLARGAALLTGALAAVAAPAQRRRAVRRRARRRRRAGRRSAAPAGVERRGSHPPGRSRPSPSGVPRPGQRRSSARRRRRRATGDGAPVGSCGADRRGMAHVFAGGRHRRAARRSLVLVAGVPRSPRRRVPARRLAATRGDGAALASPRPCCLAVADAAARDDFVTGLLAAWPIVLLPGPVRLDGTQPSAERALLGGCLAVRPRVLATQYAEGGGLEWGGRFLSPVLVPLAVVAAAGLGAVPASPFARRRPTYAGSPRSVAGLVAVPALPASSPGTTCVPSTTASSPTSSAPGPPWSSPSVSLPCPRRVADRRRRRLAAVADERDAAAGRRDPRRALPATYRGLRPGRRPRPSRAGSDRRHRRSLAPENRMSKHVFG